MKEKFQKEHKKYKKGKLEGKKNLNYYLNNNKKNQKDNNKKSKKNYQKAQNKVNIHIIFKMFQLISKILKQF